MMARLNGKDRGLFEKPAGSGKWWIRYSDGDGTEHREKAGTKSAAKALYQKRKVAVRSGEKLPELVKARIYTFAQLAADAMVWSRAYKESWKDDEARLKPLILSFGQRGADSITAPEFEQWMDKHKVEKGLAPATMNRYRAVLQMLYREGKRLGKVKTNPARDISPRASAKSIIRFLSDEEEKRLVAELKDPVFKVEFYFALLTGMRRGDQYGLRWDDIDFERRTAHIRNPKNGEERYVPLHEAVIAMLSDLPKDSSGYVFRKGKVNRGYGMTWWHGAMKRAGIKNFRWHDLRHTFASRLAMTGHGLKTIKDALGHKSIVMADRYSHLQQEHVQEAVDTFKPVTLNETGVHEKGWVN